MNYAEIQKHALDLPDSDRAMLAGDLLESLPAVMEEEDDGVAEALRRAEELDNDPSMGCSWEEITEELHIARAIARGRADIAAGRSWSHDEVKKLLDAMIERDGPSSDFIAENVRVARARMRDVMEGHSELIAAEDAHQMMRDELSAMR